MSLIETLKREFKAEYSYEMELSESKKDTLRILHPFSLDDGTNAVVYLAQLGDVLVFTDLGFLSRQYSPKLKTLVAPVNPCRPFLSFVEFRGIMIGVAKAALMLEA